MRHVPRRFKVLSPAWRWVRVRWKRVALLAIVGSASCSEYDLTKEPSGTFEVGVGDSADTDRHDTSSIDTPPAACGPEQFLVEAVEISDTCGSYDLGGYNPVVEWDVAGKDSTALPAVADLDGDGMPEVIVNWADLFPGDLAVYEGDGSGEVWTDSSAELAYGSGLTVADLDDDGRPEILGVRNNDIDVGGHFSVVAWSAEGAELWQSEVYSDGEFDNATGVSVSDMDHDGSPEIVAGRAILNADGTPRGNGQFGRGCPLDGGFFQEGAFSAVADLDLDGVEEVVVGNALYGPDGEDLWHTDARSDGAVAVANLDDDPEAEWVVTQNREIRAHDTDGEVLWELEGPAASLFSVAAIGDVDGDGAPEVVVGASSELWVLNGEDGSLLWSAAIEDTSGATGASLFDFDGDGILEVVYADEVQMFVFDGSDGEEKFWTREHASATMYDYPVIADVDADGQAEIVLAHYHFDTGLTVYGSDGGTWAPARKIWNQHAYSITNINDDLSVPQTPSPNFTLYNSWHSAQATIPSGRIGGDLQAEILEICEDECGDGILWVTGRGLNAGSEELAAGVSLALYAARGDGALLGTATTTSSTPSGTTTEALVFRVVAAEVGGAGALVVRVDDDGNGMGRFAECFEDNNEDSVSGSWCR